MAFVKASAATPSSKSSSAAAAASEITAAASEITAASTSEVIVVAAAAAIKAATSTTPMKASTTSAAKRHARSYRRNQRPVTFPKQPSTLEELHLLFSPFSIPKQAGSHKTFKKSSKTVKVSVLPQLLFRNLEIRSLGIYRTMLKTPVVSKILLEDYSLETF